MSHAQHRPFARLRLRRNLTTLSLLLVTAFATVLVPAPRGARAAGTTWNVDSSGGACTQADPKCATIQAAVNAASDGDTILVAAGVYDGGLFIAKSLTINGAGAAATIVGRGFGGTVFTIESGTVSLSGMTLTGGGAQFGGGILNIAGTVNVTHVIISGNVSAGGIFNNRLNGGGGIFNGGTMTVTNSIVSDNRGLNVILNGGTMIILNSTVSNPASLGISNDGTLNVTGSTVSNNSGAGIANSLSGKIVLTSSTISGNSVAFGGGGVFNSNPDASTFQLRSSIVAGNGTSSARDLFGHFTSQGHNLIGVSDGPTGFTNGTGGDIVGTAAAPVDPKLLALGYYGGPTPTQPPRPSSPAIDAGDDSVLGPPLNLLTDPRGSARVVGPHADIGAVEFDPNADTIDNPRFFVTMHYNDFLGRAPDDAGLNFWAGQLTACGSDAACTSQRRQNVSAAFFLSIEFQQTGYYVYRVYKAAYGDINPPQVPVPLRFQDFLRDRQAVGQGVVVGQGPWQRQLANNKQAFALAFVRRPEFQARYPGLTSATAFVNILEANAGGALNDAERSALISELSPNPVDPLLRADVLQKVAENALFQRAEFDRAFVLMQYFGYLRRNPDDAPDADFSGYDFWLSKLDGFGGNFVQAEMVKAFIDSDEYRKRFTP